MKKENLPLCHYCELPSGNLTRDHKFPISKIRRLRDKGEPLPEGVDVHDNIVMACGICNNLKGNKDYHSFKSLGVKQIRHMKKQFKMRSIKKHIINNTFKKSKTYRKRKFKK